MAEEKAVRDAIRDYSAALFGNAPIGTYEREAVLGAWQRYLSTATAESLFFSDWFVLFRRLRFQCVLYHDDAMVMLVDEALWGELVEAQHRALSDEPHLQARQVRAMAEEDMGFELELKPAAARVLNDRRHRLVAGQGPRAAEVAAYLYAHGALEPQFVMRYPQTLVQLYRERPEPASVLALLERVVEERRVARRLAVAMAFHPRLGGNPSLAQLDPDLVSTMCIKD